MKYEQNPMLSPFQCGFTMKILTLGVWYYANYLKFLERCRTEGCTTVTIRPIYCAIPALLLSSVVSIWNT